MKKAKAVSRGDKKGRKRAPRASLQDVHAVQVRNLLKMQKDGQALSPRDLDYLGQHLPGHAVLGEDGGRAERATYLNVSEFLRWAEGEGLKISRKSFYKTYFGRGARHPVPKSKDGTKVKAEEALELIRLVQGNEPTDATRIIQERQAAETRAKTARARLSEIEVATKLGQRVPTQVVKKVWGRAIENLRTALRSNRKNIGVELQGKTPLEIEQILEAQDVKAFQHVARELAYT